MKIGILTFHFAHNYGAVLQAYALKSHLENKGHYVNFINFRPNKLKDEYSLNPFLRDHYPKAILKRFISIPLRYKQCKLFDSFINNELVMGEEYISDDSKIDLKKYDAIICGSDQIWNENITGKISTYYINFYNPYYGKKIAYAASFGSSILSDFQKNCISAYLSDFSAISLREPDAIDEIRNITGKDVISVLDPVFFLTKEEWKEFSKNINMKIPSKYILYYALKNDKELIDKTKQLSEKYKLPVLCIHPTCKNLETEWKQLNNVGPKEFVHLVKNASFVCTNSFHASAFSIILSKRLVYKAFSGKESRVPTLLSLCEASNYYVEEFDGYDFCEFDLSLINEAMYNSRKFINDALK